MQHLLAADDRNQREFLQRHLAIVADAFAGGQVERHGMIIAISAARVAEFGHNIVHGMPVDQASRFEDLSQLRDDTHQKVERRRLLRDGPKVATGSGKVSQAPEVEIVENAPDRLWRQASKTPGNCHQVPRRPPEGACPRAELKQQVRRVWDVLGKENGSQLAFKPVIRIDA